MSSHEYGKTDSVIEDNPSKSEAESKKKEKWLEQLKGMPDVRHEKLDPSLQKETPQDLHLLIAKKIEQDLLGEES